MADPNPFDQFDQKNPFDQFDSVDHSNIVSKSLAATVKTPFGLPETSTHSSSIMRGLSAFPGLGPFAQPEQKQWTPEEQEMAKGGTDITSGAPLKLRNTLSLLVRPTDIETGKSVNAYFGQDVGLTRNKYNELEYTNPQTGRRTLLNPRSDTLQGLAPTVGGAMDSTLSTAGALGAGVPTAAATGNAPLAGIAATGGAMVGQTISDAGKTLISQALGIAPERSATEQLSAIGKDAAITGGWTGVGETVGMVPNLLKFASHGFLDLKYGRAKDLRDLASDAANGLNDYNKLIGSQKGVNPSIDELLPPGELSTGARIAKEKAYKSDEALTAEEEHRINSNLDTLAYNYQTFSDAFKPRPDYQTGEAGYNIQQAIQAKKAQALAAQQLDDAINKADAQGAINGLPAMTETERNQMGTEILDLVKQAGKDKKDQAYGDLRVSLGVPKEVAYDRTSGAWLQGRKTEDQVELSPVAKAKMQNLWQEGMNLQRSPLRSGDKYFSAIPEDFFADVNRPDLGLSFDGKKYDILSLIDNIQDLHSGTRAAMAASKGRIPADEQASAHVAEALENDVKYFLNRKGDPRILDQWEVAKQANIEFEENFGRGLMNTVIGRTGGFENPVYNSFSAKVLMSGGKGQDQSGVAKFAKILDGYPDEKERVRGMIWSIYKDHYIPPSGIPDKGSWQKFTDQMEGPMKYFFGDGDKAKVASFSDMTDNLAASAKRLATFNQVWRASPEFGGIPTTSQGLSNAVFREGTSPQVLRKMISLVKNLNPTLYKEWQADTALQFARRSADASGMPVDSVVSRMINQYGDRLSSVMGPQYVSNLRTYQRVAQMVQGGSGIKLDPDRPQSVLTQIIRAKFAPPLSAEGRWYQALLNWRKRAAGRVVYNALKSPAGLDRFIRESAAAAARPTALGVLSNLRGEALYNSLQSPAQPQGEQQQTDLSK